MTLFKQDFEAPALGAVPSTSNLTGTGMTPPVGVAIGAGATMVIDATHVGNGSKSVKVTPGTDGTEYFHWSVNSASLAAAWKLFLTALPTVDMYLIRFCVGGTRKVSLHINGAGKLRVYDSTGAGGTLFTFANTVPLNQEVRVELFGQSASSGATVKAAYYLGDSTTPVESVYSTSAANGGGSAFTDLIIGQQSSQTPGTGPFWMDSVMWDDAATDLVGPWAAPAPTPPTEVINDRALYVIDRHSSTGTGTSLSYAITQTAGTTTTPTLLAPGVWGVVQPTSGTLTYTVTVTTVGGADDGATATDTVTVPAAATSTVTRTMLQWVPGSPGSWQ